MCAAELIRIYFFGLFYHLVVINPTHLFSGMLEWVCIELPSLPLPKKTFVDLGRFALQS